MTRLIAVGTKIRFFHFESIERVLELFLNGTTPDIFPPPCLEEFDRLAMVLSVSHHRSYKADQFWNYVEAELLKPGRQEEIAQHSHVLLSLVNQSRDEYLDNLLILESLQRVSTMPRPSARAELLKQVQLLDV